MSMIGKEFDKMRTELMEQKEADEIINEVVREREMFTNNELPQKNEQPVKEYKNRIYTVDYEEFSLKGSPVRQGTVEVLGEKTVDAGTLTNLVKQLYPTIFSGTSGVILQFNDNMFHSIDRGKRVLVISLEVGRT